MMENKDFRTIYNILIALMVNLCIGEMIRSYNENNILLDLSMFTYGFERFHLVIFIWLLMFLWSMIVVFIVGWVNEKRISNTVWLSLYIFSLVVIFVGPPVFCLYVNLAMINSIVVTCEMSRMAMKMHSYLREKLLFGIKGNQYATWIPEDLKKRGITVADLNIPDITISNSRWEEIRKYAFFHFCPTLIYRDSYPRLGSKRRWNLIFYNLFNIIGVIVFTYIIFQTSCVPNFKDNWNSPWSAAYIVDSWFKAMIPGTFLLFLGFFGVLHSW